MFDEHTEMVVIAMNTFINECRIVKVYEGSGLLQMPIYTCADLWVNALFGFLKWLAFRDLRLVINTFVGLTCM